jgi:hypothetical protein
MQAALAGPPTNPRIRQLVKPGQARVSGTAAVWLPWLAAPLFMAAPIGGCAVAERWRPSVAHAAEQPATLVEPVVPIVPAGAVVPAVGR